MRHQSGSDRNRGPERVLIRGRDTGGEGVTYRNLFEWFLVRVLLCRHHEKPLEEANILVLSLSLSSRWCLMVPSKSVLPVGLLMILLFAAVPTVPTTGASGLTCVPVVHLDGTSTSENPDDEGDAESGRCGANEGCEQTANVGEEIYETVGVDCASAAAKCKNTTWQTMFWEVQAKLADGNPDSYIRVEMHCGGTVDEYDPSHAIDHPECKDDEIESEGCHQGPVESPDGGYAICWGLYFEAKTPDQSKDIKFEFECADPVYPWNIVPKRVVELDELGNVLEIRSIL